MRNPPGTTPHPPWVKRAQQTPVKAFHVVYAIRNTITDELYVGVHSSHHRDDGYMGSSEVLRAEIEQNGIDHLEKTEVAWFSCRELALACESAIIKKLSENNNLLNLTLDEAVKINAGRGYQNITVKQARQLKDQAQREKQLEQARLNQLREDLEQEKIHREWLLSQQQDTPPWDDPVSQAGRELMEKLLDKR